MLVIADGAMCPEFPVRSRHRGSSPGDTRQSARHRNHLRCPVTVDETAYEQVGAFMRPFVSVPIGNFDNEIGSN